MKDENLSQNKNKNVQDLSERDNLNVSTSRKKVGDKTINISQDDSRLNINQPKDNDGKPLEEGQNPEGENKEKPEAGAEVDYDTLYDDKELFDEQFVEQEEWKVFHENSKKYVLQAFIKEKPDKEEWSKEFINLAVKEEKVFKSTKEFDSYVKKKFTNVETVKYSVNTSKEGVEIKGDQIFLFPKLIMFVNLIFQITFVYTFQYETGYKKIFITLLNTLVLAFFDFSSTQTLIQLPISQMQMAFIAASLVWILSVLLLLKKCGDLEMMRKIENAKYTYEIKKRQLAEDGKTEVPYQVTFFDKLIFFLPLFFNIILYIPITRDSFSSVVFVYDQYKTVENLQNFLQDAKSRDMLQISIIVVSCFNILIALYFPYKLLDVLKNNFPLLDPYVESETIFHSINCPDDCIGFVLDMDRRVCWDYVKDDLFHVDLTRPIVTLDKEEKVKNIVTKYRDVCRSNEAPLLIFFNGYSYYWRYHYVWFLLKNFLFVFIIKLPYSKLFNDFKTNNLANRTLISYSVGAVFSIYLFIENIMNLRRKYVLLYDGLIDLVLSLAIAIIGFFGLDTDKQDYYKSLMEGKGVLKIVISFGSICVSLLLIFISIILTFPCFKSYFESKEFQGEKKLNRLTRKDIVPHLMECLWKPFWDNLFNVDNTFLLKPLKLNENFKNKYLGGKNIPDNTFTAIASTPVNRLLQLKKRSSRPGKIDNDEVISKQKELNTKLSKCDLLMRKWLQHRLEGIDIFWDGEVIGKRTCHTFFGRMLINEFPFKVYIIYDETNEKAEVPEHEWVIFARLNFQNKDTLRQKFLREQLRALNKQIVKYDEFYYEKKEKAEKEKLDKELENQGDDGKGLLKKKSKKKKTKSSLDVVEDINKMKDASLQMFSLGLIGKKEDTEKVGVLRVESIVPDNMLLQGLNVYFDEKDKSNPNSKLIKSTTKFDAGEISINVKNFKFTKINALMQLNEDKIKDDILQKNSEKKVNYRYETTFRRFIDEITLSNLFIDIIYDDTDVTILEIFMYFLKFERRKKMKLFPYFHIEGLIFVSNLWELCSTNEIHGFWYLFFLNLWKNNKSQIESLGKEKYFNPDSKYSLCYYAMSRQSLEGLIKKFGMIEFINRRVLNDLYDKIEKLNKESKGIVENIPVAEGKEKEKEKTQSLPKKDEVSNNLSNIKDENKQGEEEEKQQLKIDEKSSKKEKVSEKKMTEKVENEQKIEEKKVGDKLSQKEEVKSNDEENAQLSNPTEKISDTQLRKLQEAFKRGNEMENNKNKIIQNKFDKELNKDSPIFICAQTWTYFTLNDETETNRIPLDLLQSLKSKKSNFFKNKISNLAIIFNEIGEKYNSFLSMYNDDEICQLYENKFNIGKLDIDEGEQVVRDYANSSHHAKENFKNPVNEYGNRLIELKLPPLFKFIDPMYEAPMGNLWTTKVDNRGRIFFVDRGNKVTTFNHPKMKKREKSKIEIDYDHIYGPLPPEWEVIDYYSEENKMFRLLYINHRLRVTSWIDPRKKD